MRVSANAFLATSFPAVLLLLCGHGILAFNNIYETRGYTRTLTSTSLQANLSRRNAIERISTAPLVALLPSLANTPMVDAKCTDIDSCREIGEKKEEKELKENPITITENGSRYKVLKTGFGDEVVKDDSKIDLIYSVSTLSNGYIYSQGMGYENIDVGNGKKIKDAGLDSLRVEIGKRDVPVGIESALVGMKKGERRRVELPPRVGFATSNWKVMKKLCHSLPEDIFFSCGI